MTIPAELAELMSARGVRRRAQELLTRAEDGLSDHFIVRRERLANAVDAVVDATRRRYPDLVIPYHSRWRHFRLGELDLADALFDEARAPHPDEQARQRIDLAVTSVLLDAGAGPGWSYRHSSGARLARSEGLAIASLDAFATGAFSSDRAVALRADAAGLEALDERLLARAFQVTQSNPLVGLSGRAALMRGLGTALRAAPHLFGADCPRPGNLLDLLRRRHPDGNVPAASVLEVVLDGFGPIWPGRLRHGDTPLGDVWRHRAIQRDDATTGLLPLHKLSQWMTYSLLEPLQGAGLAVTGLDELTGLAEYRNGGLMLDAGILATRDATALDAPIAVDAELVVEWRALTVALLDDIAASVRQHLDLPVSALPLASVLEGGTWAAGRQFAAERRDGLPPFELISDGTVF
ncbi:MAG: DUF1688 family protein [Pseudomonadota bacterium]